MTPSRVLSHKETCAVLASVYGIVPWWWMRENLNPQQWDAIWERIWGESEDKPDQPWEFGA